MSDAASTIEREVAKIAMDVLMAEMGLDAEHCLLGDQAWDIPADKKLFVAIFDQAPAPFGGATYLDTDETSATFGKEIQQGSFVHDVRIDIMSFDNEARVRKEEVALALNSFYSQQLQGQYGVQIGRAQAPVDASGAENSKMLLRYVVHVKITALHQKVKTPPKADYFNKFNGATADGTTNPPAITDQQ